VRVRRDGRGRPMPGVALAVNSASADDAEWIAMLLHDAPPCVRIDLARPRPCTHWAAPGPRSGCTAKPTAS